MGKQNKRADEVDQVVEHLPSKCEALSLNLSMKEGRKEGRLLLVV
jgi:hypothetical protein